MLKINKDTYKVQTLQSKAVHCTLLTTVHVVAKSKNNLKANRSNLLRKFALGKHLVLLFTYF